MSNIMLGLSSSRRHCGYGSFHSLATMTMRRSARQEATANRNGRRSRSFATVIGSSSSAPSPIAASNRQPKCRKAPTTSNLIMLPSNPQHHRRGPTRTMRTAAAATTATATGPRRNDNRNVTAASSELSCLFSSSSATEATIDLGSPNCNIPPHIAERVRQAPKLYQRPGHPLRTIKEKIEGFFPNFECVDGEDAVVSSAANFDSLLIPADHVSRGKSDTYYVDHPDVCLRTHTSAHQLDLLKRGHRQFLCTGDVYRRDDIDKSHYPIFHQMEGVKVFDRNGGGASCDPGENAEMVMDDLKETLEGLAKHLFGPVECRWVEEYFPFTHPSLELEIWYQGDWMEVLGCGVMQPKILQDAGYDTTKHQAWAFGLGLERLAMVLFEIPDIRLFWSQDERFRKQFRQGEITKFQPYSKYPPCFKDVSFWLNHETEAEAETETDDVVEDGAAAVAAAAAAATAKTFHVNELNDLLRQVGGDLIEAVELVDEFTHPKTNRESRCYRITYRSMDRSLTNEEIDVLQQEVRDKISNQLNVELR